MSAHFPDKTNIMFDERTEFLDLRLPNLLNPLSNDVMRLRDTIQILDQYLAGINQSLNLPLGEVQLDATGKIPLVLLPESVPTGMVIDYALSELPSTAWRFCDGAALLSDDALAANLRARLVAESNPYGADESGNPLLPDARGRVTAGKDDMGGTAAGRLTEAGSGTKGAALGSSGGSQSVTLTTEQIPLHGHAVTDPGHGHPLSDPGHTHAVYDPAHAHSVYDPGHTHNVAVGGGGSTVQVASSASGVSSSGAQIANAAKLAGTGISIYAAATNISIYANTTGITISSKTTGITIADVGGGKAHSNVQPTLIVNKIIKL